MKVELIFYNMLKDDLDTHMNVVKTHKDGTTYVLPCSYRIRPKLTDIELERIDFIIAEFLRKRNESLLQTCGL